MANIKKIDKRKGGGEGLTIPKFGGVVDNQNLHTFLVCGVQSGTNTLENCLAVSNNDMKYTYSMIQL